MAHLKGLIVIVFCDLDEVFADFTGAALWRHGWTREKFESVRTPGVWNIEGFLGITKQQFWAPIRAEGIPFWESVEPLKWCDELFTMVKYYAEELYVVTSIGTNMVEERIGKLHWVTKHLPGLPLDHLFFHSNKSFFSDKPTAVLIDDKEQNVLNFVSKGGCGVLFPSRGNYLHYLHDSPLPTVEKALGVIKQQTSW